MIDFLISRHLSHSAERELAVPMVLVCSHGHPVACRRRHYHMQVF